MTSTVLSIRLTEEEKQMATELALERGGSVSDLIRELLRDCKKHDLLNQILVNTALLRCAFTAHLNDAEKKKTAEIWETEKANLDIE